MGPDWMGNVRFDLAAKYPPDTTPADGLAMLRNLLAERLKLAVHRVTREFPGYALVVAKGGFKLKPVEAGDHDSRHSNLAGDYNFDLEWSIEEPPADVIDQPPTLPVALQETLGLRLQSPKVPLDVIVVDRIERTPIEN
jgi:hypothetical protein